LVYAWGDNSKCQLGLKSTEDTNYSSATQDKKNTDQSTGAYTAVPNKSAELPENEIEL
jgi:alpha-tubulin suppressor-like RCC1 family protein